jgi:plasmid maintenance system antidote protein VapI
MKFELIRGQCRTQQGKKMAKIQGVAALLDSIKAANGIKNDAALSTALQVAPPVISKLRNGRLPLGDSMVIKMQLAFDIPVRDLMAAV